jgi:molybdopterin-containing oxidoreductase family membrane subunit
VAKIVVTPLEKSVMLPLVRPGRWYWAIVGVLAAIVAWAAYAYMVQLQDGLVVTALRDRISWGLYVSTFVFFIGISHAGTLVSAILRVTNADWRKPITRLAEAITVFALVVGASMVIIDLGRPDRLLFIPQYGRIESPILWDFTSITFYLTGSLLYLYLPLIPDLATLRDKMPTRARFRRWLYTRLAARWEGLPEQRRRLERAIGAMAILIIPVAVSVHTVVSWIFGMTLRVGWHSTILGPYFVVGAIFSGVATLIIVMAAVRKLFHLEGIIKPIHFRNLGLMLLALDIVLLYFTLSEYLTASYPGETQDVAWLTLLGSGQFAAMFWWMIIGGFIVPAVFVAVTKAKSVPAVVIAAILVNIGMWIERYLIVVPTMATPQTPSVIAPYWPSWVEWSILAGAVAAFGLLLLAFCRFFPVISMWEVAEKAPTTLAEATPLTGPTPSEVTD